MLEFMHWKEGKDRNFRHSQQGQTSGQCTSWLCLAGNQETQGNVRKTRTRAAGGTEHPLRGYSPRTGSYSWLQVSECPSPCSQGQPAPLPWYLEMWPRSFQSGLIFLWVKLGTSRI